MKDAQNGGSSAAQPQHAQTLGEYAYQIIQEQYQRVIKREKRVLADKDPEHLHQMRVGTRRLRTALQVFGAAILLPKAASANRIRDLARVLGQVRDLDVQIASLRQDYQPQLHKKEQKKLDKVLDALANRRVEAFAAMKNALTQKDYKMLKEAYSSWLERPQYTTIAQLPLQATLPDLLSPLLAHLLLHPGWHIPINQTDGENGMMLHELRKACKHVRYQTEFFIPFYGQDFENWVKEIKTLQEHLGVFQDTQVLFGILQEELGDRRNLANLEATIQQTQREALSDWEAIRQKYLDDGFRYHLHQMLLQPDGQNLKIHPELLGQQDTYASN